MANRMENIIAVLVIIAIIVSASGIWYSVTVVGELSSITDNLADLTSSMVDLTDELANLAETVGTSLETIEDIRTRLTSVEASLSPTITVVGPWSGAEMDAFLPVLARFEVLSGINVRYRILRAEDLATLLPAQFAAGTAPGDVIFMWGWFISQQAQQNHILNVTALVDETDFLNGTFDTVKVGNEIYGGAYTGKVKPGFWYRKSFFAANNLTPTTVNSTWNDFVALLSDISAVQGIVNPIVSGDGVGWPLSDITEHFLITFGSPQLQYNLISGTASWTTNPVRSIFANYLAPSIGNFSDPLTWDTTALNAWWAGDYALYFMGSWITGMVDNATDLGIIPLPGCEALVLPADYFFIPKYTQYPDEAKELFSFLISEEAQRLQVAQGGHLATNINVPLSAYPAVDRMVAEFIADFGILPDLDDTIGGNFQATFWQQLRLMWVSEPITPSELDSILAAIEAVAP